MLRDSGSEQASNSMYDTIPPSRLLGGGGTSLNRRSLAWGGLWCFVSHPRPNGPATTQSQGFRTSPKFHPAAWIHRFEPLWTPGPPRAVGLLGEWLGSLGAFGSLWGPSGASGSLRGPPGALGSLWEPSEPPGASGSLLVALRSLWEAFEEPSGTFGSLSGAFWEPSGSLREPLGIFGKLLKASGSLWEPLGAFGSL